MDIWSKQKRSQVMSRIRSKDTKPEKILRSALHKLGFRFRLYKKGLPGKPDIVLPKFGTVILVHGCFWHHHNACNEGRIPSTNSIYWKDKIMKNVARDSKNRVALEEGGWKVMTVWECEIEKELPLTLEKIEAFLIGRVGPSH